MLNAGLTRENPSLATTSKGLEHFVSDTEQQSKSEWQKP